MDAREDRVRVDARAAATGVGRCVAAVAVPVRLQEAQGVRGLGGVGRRGGTIADERGKGGALTERTVLNSSREERRRGNLFPKVEGSLVPVRCKT